MFLELLNLRLKDNSQFFEIFDASVNYQSPVIQKESLNLIANQIKKRTMPLYQKFSIIDNDNLMIHENFLGFYKSDSTSAECLFNLTRKIMS
jgi:hypothetical protein